MPSGRGRRSPGVRALAAQIRTSLDQVTAQIDEIVGRPHPTPESLHELHRSMRRLRHALGLWGRVLRPRDRTILKPLDRRLARLARLVGRVRDRDVMLALIEGGSLPSPKRADAPLVTRLRARWRDDARTGRELLRVFLRSERDAHLFEQLSATLTLPPRPEGVQSLPELLDEEEEARRERVRAAHRRARRKGSVTRLHRLRIQVRRLRHLGELRGQLDPERPALPPPVVRHLQAQLGRLHDLDIVLDGIGTQLTTSAWGEALRKERRRLRRSIEDTLHERHWPWRPSSLAGPGGPAS
jgi:CHAD domain-containing protein